MSDTTATAPATETAIQPDSTDGTAPAPIAAAPEPVKAAPTIDAATQSWVRRELDMVARGLSEEERIAANP